MIGTSKVRLHSLDALRGLAALAVVCWHWQHLQLLAPPYGGTVWPPPTGSVDRSIQPAYGLLRIFYQHGYVAVDLFFVISGFIFFWLYREKLESRLLSIREFAVLRFSRLYPLHFVVLLIVAALQFTFIHLRGQPFIYPANNGLRFLLALFFYQSMGHGSFNGPEWSLTIEIFMYALFCVLARWGLLRRALVPAIIVIAGLAIADSHNVSRGLCGFFTGGLTFMAFTRIVRLPNVRKLIPLLLGICAVGWALVIADIYGSTLATSLMETLTFRSQTVALYAVSYLLFPATVLLVGIHENVYGVQYKSIAWLGEISYSSYILHFPLQLSVAVLVICGVLPTDLAQSGLFMLLYFSVLIPLSVVVFRKFEMPMQTVLRSQWKRYTAAAP